MKNNEENLMKESEILENETEKIENVTEETQLSVINDFSAMSKKSTTKTEIFTNIKDNKKIFNLENHVDCLLNDCENELIRVKEILIKRYTKPMKNPEVDEETGEIIKDKEYSMSCILIDDNNKSYATGSKVFTIQMMNYIDMFGINAEGFEIKITKYKQESGNKTLGFELV